MPEVILNVVALLLVVMQLWWGISTNNSGRSTSTGRSTNGISSTSPGPLAPMQLPRGKTTRRRYSDTMRTICESRTARLLTRDDVPIQINCWCSRQVLR
jgi:hypothetical protein